MKVIYPSPLNFLTAISTQHTKSMSLAHSSRLEAENRSQAQKLNEQNKLMSPSPMKVSETILNIFTGKTYFLEAYRSLKDKLSLIKTAVTSHDSNAIIATTLHFKKTVISDIFMKHIVQFQFNDALNHYINYLRQKDKRELINFYEELENHHPDSSAVAEFRNEKHMLVYNLMHKKD